MPKPHDEESYPEFCTPAIVEERGIEDLCDCHAEDYPHTRRTPDNWDPFYHEYWHDIPAKPNLETDDCLAARYYNFKKSYKMTRTFLPEKPRPLFGRFIEMELLWRESTIFAAFLEQESND